MEPASANVPHFQRPYYMTYLILWINILLFFGILFYDGFSFQRLVMGPRPETLVLFGAKQNGLIAEWQLERLALPMFLHANLLHVAFNMYAFLMVGKFMELMFGSYVLAGVYIAAGLVGNVFSFALIPSMVPSMNLVEDQRLHHAILSVGASGSLFGILLFLYVVQKYQEKLSRETGVPEPRTNLGPLIIANGVITFLFPNIDWACHLGGAVAGAIIGWGFSLRHMALRRQYLAVKFLAFGDRMPKPPLWRREMTWYVGLAVLCLGLMSNLFRVGKAERALGLGILASAQDGIEERDERYIAQFSSLLANRKADTDPDTLLQSALVLHAHGHFRAAESVYVVLSFLQTHGVGSPTFLAPSTSSLIEVAYDSAKRARPLPDPLRGSIHEGLPVSTDLCRKPAETFHNLGFLVLAGLLSECAYAVTPSDLGMAAKTVELYWRSERPHLLYRFLDYVDASSEWQRGIPEKMRAPARPGAPDVDDLFETPDDEEAPRETPPEEATPPAAPQLTPPSDEPEWWQGETI